MASAVSTGTTTYKLGIGGHRKMRLDEARLHAASENCVRKECENCICMKDVQENDFYVPQLLFSPLFSRPAFSAPPSVEDHSAF